MSKKHKSKIYLLVFAMGAVALGWGVWFNYRPQAIYAGCLDIADRTHSIQTRYNLGTNTFDNDEILHNCLHDAGYYGN